MNLYLLALAVHVVTAILGLGQVAGMAVLASSTRLAVPIAPGTLAALKRLARGTTGALVLMLVSGALLDFASSGASHETYWFRLSFLLLIALGALQGMIRRALRRVDPAQDRPLPREIAPIAWAMCAIVAAAAVLMEVKPW